MQDRRIDAIVLAAGRSTRMGRPKALLPYRGRPFVRVIVDGLLEAGLRSIVVVGPPDADLLEATLPREAPVRLVTNPERDRGQISSLRRGIAELLALGDSSACLSCLVDHPAVLPATFRALAEAFAGGAGQILIPVEGGRRGHPPLFARSVYQELLDCPDEGGARNVIGADPSRVVEVDVDDPGIHVDVDTPADYDRLQ